MAEPPDSPPPGRNHPNRLSRFARRSDTPKQFGAKHQTCPHVAVHGPPDSTWEMGAAEMRATIRSPVVGDSPE